MEYKEKEFCIYAFFNQNGEPYSVGQTCDFIKRKNAHLTQIRKKNPKYYQHRVTKKIMKEGHSFDMRIIKDKLTIVNVNDEERRLIKKYKKFKLTNSTDGGRDYFNHSEETRKKMSKNNSRYWKGKEKSKEIRLKISVTKKKYFETHPGTQLGRKHTEKTKEKMRVAKIGFKYTKAQKKRLKIIRNKIKPYYTKFWKITSPKGKIYLAWGLGSFCRRFNLCQGHMQEVNNKNRRHHKGWTCVVFENKNPKIKNKVKESNYLLYYSKEKGYLLK